MDENNYRIDTLERRMVSHAGMQKAMKVLAVLNVVTIFICGLTKLDNMRLPWFASILFIGFLFLMDYYFMKQYKACEIEKYELELQQLNDRKHLAQINGETLPGLVAGKVIPKPSEEVALPIKYYCIILVLVLVTGIFIFR